MHMHPLSATTEFTSASIEETTQVNVTVEPIVTTEAVTEVPHQQYPFMNYADYDLLYLELFFNESQIEELHAEFNRRYPKPTFPPPLPVLTEAPEEEAEEEVDDSIITVVSVSSRLSGEEGGNARQSLFPTTPSPLETTTTRRQRPRPTRTKPPNRHHDPGRSRARPDDRFKRDRKRLRRHHRHRRREQLEDG
jgi:hypothetical protein